MVRPLGTVTLGRLPRSVDIHGDSDSDAGSLVSFHSAAAGLVDGTSTGAHGAFSRTGDTGVGVSTAAAATSPDTAGGDADVDQPVVPSRMRSGTALSQYHSRGRVPGGGSGPAPVAAAAALGRALGGGIVGPDGKPEALFPRFSAAPRLQRFFQDSLAESSESDDSDSDDEPVAVTAAVTVGPVPDATGTEVCVCPVCVHVCACNLYADVYGCLG